jgi:hypothetical protein
MGGARPAPDIQPSRQPAAMAETRTDMTGDGATP